MPLTGETAPRHPVRLRRSVLCLPADNARALAKTATLDMDAVIYDLEDAVLPEAKATARAMLAAHLSDGVQRPFERIIRINSLSGDTAAARHRGTGGAEAGRLSSAQGFRSRRHRARRRSAVGDRGWGRHSPLGDDRDAAGRAQCCGHCRGRAHARLPARLSRAGLNDLRKEGTRVPAAPGRSYLVPWLMQILLAARAAGLDVIDAVFNDFRDAAGWPRNATRAAPWASMARC